MDMTSIETARSGNGDVILRVGGRFLYIKPSELTAVIAVLKAEAE